MPLFQLSASSKHLKTLDKQAVQAAYIKFKAHFHNPIIQENIRNSKKEQYQEGFLNDLFVNVLGYTKNPAENYNLTTEYKNVKDSKKADGAILSGQTRRHAPLSDPLYSSPRGHAPLVIGVIELKGMNATDLGHVEVQAFSYKNNQPECVYVITSNFEKLRLYIDNAIEYLEFNLFTLSEKDFELLYLCLAFSQIEKGIPKKIKDESISLEDDITKQLYHDYSLFKRELHADLVAKNPEYDTLVLFRKSQKLLSRFLFLFFAEDRQLLPPNSVRLILNDWRDLQKRDVEIPLYDRFKKYFEYLNTGFKGKRYDVFAYNGGLFKPDTVLDTVKIADELLNRHTARISEYDFASEVDVNILGHIFENSLNELDELKAEIAGETIDKSKTKRKKDGVFYTPKYITKYIVDNTLGRLCAEKKAELGIEPDITTTTMGQTFSTMGQTFSTMGHAPLQRKTKQALYNKLTTYRKWLLQITICDPACGSGAFLNQALNFLIDEHRYIDELQAKLFGDSLVISDIENTILENNLFGVDLNEESVEIAKLSLWLRTAQPNRKLNDLSRNIKCGNSLIDDPTVAGEKAFNWEKEFPQVFELKQKKAWHITTATHNSRYSQRMFDNYVKLGEPVWLSEKEELIVSQTIAEIAVKDNLNILAYNVCGDHIHLLLVCEKEEVEKIVGKLKSMSARACNIAMGRTIPTPGTTGHTTSGTTGHAPLSSDTPSGGTMGHAPLLAHGTTQTQLWTQKFGNNEIKSDEQLYNTLRYIENNRLKHELSDIDKDLQPLINQMKCSIQHAFRTEYKGGFDVVIGNPPYVGIRDNKQYYENSYTLTSSGDLYSLFYEKGCNLLKKNGYLGLITPSSLFTNIGFTVVRTFLLNNFEIKSIVDLGSNVFSDASVDSGIVILKNNYSDNYYILCSKNDFKFIELEKKYFLKFDNTIFNIYSNEIEFELTEKLDSKCLKLEKFVEFYRGVEFGFKSDFVFDSKLEQDFKPLICGGNVNRYCINFENKYIKFDFQNQSIYKNIEIYENEKILVRRIGNRIISVYDNVNLVNVCDVYNLLIKDVENFSLKYILVLLNSKLISYYYNIKFKSVKILFPKIPIQNLKQVPIPNIPLQDQQPFIAKADQMLSLNKKLQEVSGKFQRNLTREFALDSLPSKQKNWQTFSYAEFIKELEKQKVKLSLHQKAELETYFQQETNQAHALKTQIDSTDREIDQLVYQLYGLTEEEIRIVENV